MSRPERVPPHIARRLPRLFERRYSGCEAHPKRAVRYPALTRTAERWRDLIMTRSSTISRKRTRESALMPSGRGGPCPKWSLYPSPVYPVIIGLDRLKIESVA
jgi:hypothetical protein